MILLHCDGCNRAYPREEYLITAPEKMTYAGKRVLLVKHRRCRHQTIVFATAQIRDSPDIQKRGERPKMYVTTK